EAGPLGPRGVLHPADQLVGLAGHGGYDDRHLVAGVDLAFDMPRHIADAGDVGDRSPAEFHHDARHGSDWSPNAVRDYPRKTEMKAPPLARRECAASLTKSALLRKRRSMLVLDIRVSLPDFIASKETSPCLSPDERPSTPAKSSVSPPWP